MVFFNDEETENGGLIFGGADGESDGGLSFDAYEQDQIVQIIGHKTPPSMTAGLVVNQTPDQSIEETIRAVEEAGRRPDSEQVIERMQAEGALGRRRVFVGVRDGDEVVDLRDGDGRPRLRLRLRVTKDGSGSIDFLSESGEVVSRLGPQE